MGNVEFKHKSVLLDECIEMLNIKKDGIYVDGTLGGAGHTSEILKRLSIKGQMIGIDQDEEALENARKLISKDNFRVLYGNFRDVDKLIDEKVDGVLLDIGVSSYQLDNTERGFSYTNNARLDMRMDSNNSLDAYRVVNEYERDSLYRLIKEYGEERYAGRIASAIERARGQKKIETTEELSQIIVSAMPSVARKEDQHPAKRTFQAIRIEVNDELGALKDGIQNSFEILKKGGRLCIITFHSLEDRIVKRMFAEIVKPCICPKEFPVCMCNKVVEGKLITNKPIIPTKEELEENPRARSAKLRVIEKIV